MKELNQRGIFPLENETLENFLLRASLFSKKNDYDHSDLIKKFDIAPDWVEVEFSNKNLTPWEGGATFADRVQLRKSFQNKEKLFGIYSRKEIIEHELVHAVRFPLNSVQFEEFFAYRTSKYKYRSLLGTLFQKTNDALIALFVIFLSMLLPLFGFFEALFLPFPLIAFGFFRTFALFRKYRQCKAALQRKNLPADAILFRLTDEEILHFTFDYFQSPKTLRHQMIAEAYFRG